MKRRFDLRVSREAFPTAVLIWIFALASYGAGGGLSWEDSGQSLGGDAASSDVALADFDLDGDLDAVITTFVSAGQPGGSRVYLNNDGAPGSFSLDVQILETGRAGEVAVGDLNGDGYPDLFICAENRNTSVWINHGDSAIGQPGEFYAQSQTFAFAQSSGVAMGDLDGDGDLDVWLTIVNQADHILLNDGSGLFTRATADLETDASYAVDFADVDGDGDLDAAVATSLGATVWINQGGTQGGQIGEFAKGQALDSLQIADIAFGDLDGDGDPDLFGSGNPDRVWWNVDLKSGVFEPHVSASGLSISATVEVIDLGPGESVALATGKTDGDVTASRWNATEQDFEVLSFLEGTGWVTGIASGDLNGDQGADLVIARYGFPDDVILGAAARDDLEVASIRFSSNYYFVKAYVTGVGEPIACRGYFINSYDKRGALIPVERLLSSNLEEVTVEFPDTDYFRTTSSSLGGRSGTICANTPVHGFRSKIVARLGDLRAEAEVEILTHQGNCATEFVFEYYSRFAAVATSTSFRNFVQPGGVVLRASPFKSLESLLSQTDSGSRLRDLYWKHSPEVVSITLDHPDLLVEMGSLFVAYQPGVASLLSGRGDVGTTITQDMIDRVNSVWDQLIEYGSDGLRAALVEERDRFNGFSVFVGVSMNQWGGMLGLAAVDAPFIVTSYPRIEEGAFLIEANLVEGYDYSLWSSSEVEGGVWERVEDAEVYPQNGVAVLLLDPTPADGSIFYQVRAAEPGM